MLQVCIILHCLDNPIAYLQSLFHPELLPFRHLSLQIQIHRQFIISDSRGGEKRVPHALLGWLVFGHLLGTQGIPGELSLSLVEANHPGMLCQQFV